jgi:hypothetical protein
VREWDGVSNSEFQTCGFECPTQVRMGQNTAAKLAEPLASLLQTFFESRICLESQKRLIKILSPEG